MAQVAAQKRSEALLPERVGQHGRRHRAGHRARVLGRLASRGRAYSKVGSSSTTSASITSPSRSMALACCSLPTIIMSRRATAHGG
jgi:hypothetical protein